MVSGELRGDVMRGGDESRTGSLRRPCCGGGIKSVVGALWFLTVAAAAVPQVRRVQN